MKYPNAYNGICKIIVAEIFYLIYHCLVLISYMFLGLGVSQSDTISRENSLQALILVIVMLLIVIISIIGFIVRIVGINQAKKDEPHFKKALAWIVAGISMALIDPALDSLQLTLGDLIDLFAGVFGLMAMICVLKGIENLAADIGSDEITERTAAVKKLIIVFYAVFALFRLVNSVFCFFMGRDYYVGAVFGMIMMMIPMIASIISSVLYLRVIIRAREMLGSAQL